MLRSNLRGDAKPPLKRINSDYIPIERGIDLGKSYSFDLYTNCSVISFLLLVWLLSAKAWGPLMKMMEERRVLIEIILIMPKKKRQQAEKIKTRISRRNA
jgi:hypothetical protein